MPDDKGKIVNKSLGEKIKKIKLGYNMTTILAGDRPIQDLMEIETTKSDEL
jgi:hypothetical protein